MNPVLTIDPEFEAKCPPLTDDELSQLEENILEAIEQTKEQLLKQINI